MKSLAFVTTCLALAIAGCGDGSSSATTSGAPSTDDRIEELFPGEPSFGVVDREQVRRMLEVPPEEDEPFYMVNLIRHRDRARYRDGRETDLTGAEADGVYGSLIHPILDEIGAEIVFVADAEKNLIDADGAAWDQVGVVRYPSYAAFFEMIVRDDLREAAEHKQAGVEKSIVLVGHLEGDPFPDEFLRVDLAAVPFPPTAADPPIAIVHLLDYNDVAQYEDGRATHLTGREAMRLYEQGRSDQGVLQLGVRPGLRLAIEGELIGDGRGWEEFRINNFPSRATFAQIITPGALEEAGIEHRVAALRETYALLTAPLLTTVGYR